MLTAVHRAQRTRLSASGIGLRLSRAMRSRHVSGAIVSLAPVVIAVGLAHLPFAGIGVDQPEHRIAVFDCSTPALAAREFPAWLKLHETESVQRCVAVCLSRLESCGNDDATADQGRGRNL